MEIARHFDAPVVMRGYKRESGNVGDEAKMMKKAGIKVYVGDRIKNISLLNKQKSSGPIVMDDGFQNPTIKKDISILVFDEGIGLGNGFILPAGPLREPLSATDRADAAIIIKSGKTGPNFKLPRGIPVFYATRRNIMPENTGRIVAFAGIGYPRKFFDALEPAAIETASFPDHHKYTPADLKKLFDLAGKNNAELVTTEKDWARLSIRAQKKIKAARLETTIEPAFWAWLEKKIK
jgi:tetraacyldisaccharide 4'-kinase